MKEEQRFKAFTQELEELTKKYGITLKSIGGVQIFPHPKDLISEGFKGYTNDETSGDLEPLYDIYPAQVQLYGK